MITIMTTLYGICRTIINSLRNRILSNVQDHVFMMTGFCCAFISNVGARNDIRNWNHYTSRLLKHIQCPSMDQRCHPLRCPYNNWLLHLNGFGCVLTSILLYIILYAYRNLSEVTSKGFKSSNLSEWQLQMGKPVQWNLTRGLCAGMVVQ